jgi:hypothetical protein
MPVAPAAQEFLPVALAQEVLPAAVDGRPRRLDHAAGWASPAAAAQDVQQAVLDAVRLAAVAPVLDARPRRRVSAAAWESPEAEASNARLAVLGGARFALRKEAALAAPADSQLAQAVRRAAVVRVGRQAARRPEAAGVLQLAPAVRRAAVVRLERPAAVRRREATGVPQLAQAVRQAVRRPEATGVP